MKRNGLEWLILVSSVLAIFALVAWLAAATVRGTRPASITVEPAAEPVVTAAGWTLPITIRNEGDEAAEAVVVEARATVAGEEETAEAAVDLLAGGSEAHAIVGFSAAPEGSVTFRVLGFATP